MMTSPCCALDHLGSGGFRLQFGTEIAYTKLDGGNYALVLTLDVGISFLH